MVRKDARRCGQCGGKGVIPWTVTKQTPNPNGNPNEPYKTETKRTTQTCGSCRGSGEA